MNSLITKRLVSAGNGIFPSFVEGSKALFHYKTTYDNDIIDDSKKAKKPLEIIIGKKFKFEVWEECIKTMNLSEVAEFTVDKSLCMDYPEFARDLRDIRGGKEVKRHCCGTMQSFTGYGYPDLDLFMKEPKDLTFIIELIEVKQPDEFDAYSDFLKDDEKVDKIAALHKRGNDSFHSKNFGEASTSYKEALALFEDLLIKELPNSDEWKALNSQKTPILLNYCQCLLYSKDYYEVIRHTSEVLQHDPSNVKALFRRGKAHSAVSSFAEARSDFTCVSELDETLAGVVKKELNAILKGEKVSLATEKEMFSEAF